MKSAIAAAPLLENCLAAHMQWIEEAGQEHLLRRTGYLQVYRNKDKLEESAAAKEKTRQRFGITYQKLDRDGTRELEPHLEGDFVGGIWIDQPVCISNPGALGKAYAELFTQAGGAFLTADADTFEAIDGGWQVQNVQGPIRATHAVVALGPWSGRLLARDGVKVPLAAKRGYHMHYSARGNAGLSRPVLDTDNGFVLVPMDQGIRLTTGAEFARFGAPATPVQLEAAEPIAGELFPLGQRIDEKPWLGSRPCLPDMLPVIGAVPSHKGLWANFGQHHLGFTLGPISGRLLAEMMTGAPTFTDPAPYRIDRF